MAARTIKLKSTVHRIVLAAALLIYVAAAFFSARWSFGNTISLQPEYKEVAEVAVGLAPADPQTHYSLAVLTEQKFLPDELAASLAEYEKTAALAPADYRLWLALGVARERRGDAAGAALAIRKAVELAPAYAQVQWRLGNVLLRQGKTSEAFAEIRNAADRDRKYVEPAVETAWNLLDGDLPGIRTNLGGAIYLNFALAVYLAKQKRFDDAIEVWETLPSDAKRAEFRATGKILAEEMLAAGRYRDALEVQNQIAAPEAALLQVGEFYNPGFESEINTAGGGFFDWRIGDGLKPQIGFDNVVQHSGSRSLIVIFDSTDGAEFRNLSQTIAIEGGRKYWFRAFFRSDLKTSSTLRWEIADAAGGQTLASTDPIPVKSEWAGLSAEFTVPDAAGAVIVRLAREKCGPICPITGRVWFDDFSIGQ